MKEIKTYIIQNKKTREQWKASSGKIAWKQVNHAKAAWHNSSEETKSECSKVKVPCTWYSCGYEERTPYFDEQDIYEIVEVKSDVRVFTDKLVSLLESIEGNGFVVSDPDGDLIEQYIKEWRGG